jgi:hypothetical protein
VRASSKAILDLSDSIVCIIYSFVL